MREFVLNSSALEIMVAGLLFFGGIYTLFSGVSWLLTHKLLPALHVGAPLNHNPLGPDQLQRELRLSALSIVIFGAGLVVPWGLLQWGWARLAVAPTLTQTAIEVAVLMVWNEVHFYANHRLLHTRWLQAFHLPHHRSLVTTPLSSYSFHPVEAVLLGSVLLLPMVLHDFSVHALLAVPLLSLLVNQVGHSNYELRPNAPHHAFSGSYRHNAHHACFHGNYGFLFPYMDRWFGTALSEDAVRDKMARMHAPRGNA